MNPVPFVTTLSKILEINPPAAVWERCLEAAGKTAADNERIPLSVFVKGFGSRSELRVRREDAFYWIPRFDWVEWSEEALADWDFTETVPSLHWRSLAVWYARQIQHLTSNSNILELLDYVEDWLGGTSLPGGLKIEKLRAARNSCLLRAGFSQEEVSKIDLDQMKSFDWKYGSHGFSRADMAILQTTATCPAEAVYETARGARSVWWQEAWGACEGNSAEVNPDTIISSQLEDLGRFCDGFLLQIPIPTAKPSIVDLPRHVRSPIRTAHIV